MHGQSSAGDGIVGESGAADKSGLYATNTNAAGWGVNGSNSGALTNGYVAGRNGVFGQARGTSGSGVVGYSGAASPITGPAKTGVYGYANHDAAAVGVNGQSPKGRGVVASGGAAQLRLVPSSAATHPATGQPGDLFLDKSHRLWLCKGGTTWVKVA